MKKAAAVLLVVLLGIIVFAPGIAFAQEVIPTAEMMAPIGMVTFGLAGLIGGASGYLLRRRNHDE